MAEQDPYEERDTAGGGYNLIAYLLPVGLIVGVVIYLFAANPGTQDALDGDDDSPTATPTLAVVAASASPPPPATPTAVPAPRSTLSIGDPFLGFGRSIPRWDSATRGWDTSGVEWEGVLPRWWQDGPRVRFIARHGNVYLFHADGLLPGETIEPEEATVAFKLAGWRVQPRRIRLAAAPHDGTGLDIRVTFDRDLAGLIGPSVTLAIEGSMGSVAEGSAPYVHEGTRPELAYRLSEMLNQIVASDRVRIVTPAELPANSTVQWADYVVGTHLNVRAIGWLVPAAGGWVSLVAAETASCAVPIERCFGAAAPALNAGAPVDLGGREWMVGRAEGQWVALGKVDETFVMLTASDQDLVLDAAASMQ